nr:MAG TPA: hypothetical protein [Caudoviricetes sp.]
MFYLLLNTCSKTLTLYVFPIHGHKTIMFQNN